jgi:hypothetical protein
MSPVPDRRFRKAITITRFLASMPRYRRILYNFCRKKSPIAERYSTFMDILKAGKYGYRADFRAMWCLIFTTATVHHK